MKTTLTCAIPSFSSSYEIVLSNDILNDKETLGHCFHLLNSKCVIITNDTLKLLYGENLERTLSEMGLETTLLSFPDGERYKTRATKEELENQLLEKGFGKDTCIIALGGGVVTDLAGFLAATFCRGVPLVTIPTSLLGMIDAGIGGKTGVNTPFGKNMLGCIYQPKKVLIDQTTLRTLPPKEIKNGVVEMIKHGLIADANYFTYLEEHIGKLLRLDFKVVNEAIFESCRIKTSIVSEDEKEQGKRHLLNFGHTVAHALETLSHYSLPHGEAVAIGLLVESHLSMQLGHLKKSSFDRIFNSLVAVGLPLKIPFHYTIEGIIQAMVSDKKSLNKQPRFVMIEEIGKPLTQNGSYCARSDETILKNALEWMRDDLCRR